MTIKNNNYIIFLFFVFCALISRLIYFIYFSDYDYPPLADAKSYHETALRIKDLGFFGSNLHTRPILFPLILSILYQFIPSSDSFIYGRLFTILISSFSVGFFYLILSKISKNKAFIYFGTIFFLIYPPSIYYSVLLYTENLATLLILILTFCFLCIHKDREKNRYFIYFVVGFLFGLLTLTRSSFLLLPFFILFTQILIKFLFSKELLPIKALFLIIIFYLVSLTPWTLRNYYEHDTFMPTTSRLGYGLFLCNNDFSDPIILEGGYARTEKFEFILQKSLELPVGKQSGFLIKQSINEIFENKYQFVLTVKNRFINLLNFRPNPYKELFTTNDLIMMIIWLPLLTISAFSVFRRLSGIEYLFLTYIIYVILFHLPFWGFPRFRYPVDPFFILLSINTIYIILKKIKKRSKNLN